MRTTARHSVRVQGVSKLLSLRLGKEAAPARAGETSKRKISPRMRTSCIELTCLGTGRRFSRLEHYALKLLRRPEILCFNPPLINLETVTNR